MQPSGRPSEPRIRTLIGLSEPLEDPINATDKQTHIRHPLGLLVVLNGG